MAPNDMYPVCNDAEHGGLSVVYSARHRGFLARVVYSGTSLIRSPTGLGKSDLNGEVTVLQGAKLHCGIEFGTANG